MCGTPVRFVAALVTSLLLGCFEGAAGELRPNILFIITDDQRWDMMGNVTPLLHTPEMDKLAREGVRFEQAFVTTPICAASRASILCGVVERTHRYTFKTPRLTNDWVDLSYPKLLRENGYLTAHVGKLGVDLHAGAPAKMFDYFKPTAPPYRKQQTNGTVHHLTDVEGDLANEFLEHAASKGQPFCLTVGFNAPHAEDANPLQYVWQEEVDALYANVRVPRPPLSDPAFYNQLPDYLRDGTMNRHRWYWRFDFESKRQQMTKGYWRMISGVDLVIGRLRHSLHALGLAHNTIIILMGDNGYFLGERGYAGKWLPYDQSIHVPLLMFDPRSKVTKAGARPAGFALNIDLAPTILEIAGVSIPSMMQGRSLVPLGRGEVPAEWREDFWVEHLMMEVSIRKHEGVRSKTHRYSRYFEAQPVLEELYDLAADPLETVNLANSPEHQKILKTMRSRTDALRDSYGGRFVPSIR